MTDSQQERTKRGDAASDHGWLLFRSGEKTKAMPFLQEAAAAGDPRSQYLLGVALYNGDGVPADAAQARTLLALASAAGVDQARVALARITSISSADPEMLLSADAAAWTAAEFCRLKPLPRLVPCSLEALTREMLLPLLRERLESALPKATRDAVDRALQARSADQPSPEKS